MVNLDLDKLEMLEQEATPRPWVAEDRFGNGYVRMSDGKQAEIYTGGKDNHFIAEVRNSLPEYLVYVRKLEKVMEAAVKLARQCHPEDVYGSGLDHAFHELDAFKLGVKP